MILHPVILLVFLLQLVHRTAYRIPINEAESNAQREDDALAQQDVRRNEGEKRNKRRNCNVVPFDVQCHGRCPYTENEWNSMRRSWNCSNERDGATYHCTDPEDDSGDPIEACGVPKYCYKGKGPVILLSNGKTADIDCKWCPEEYFNPHESIWSANVSKCPETRKNCGHPRKIECDIVTGVERYWTDSKCECDTKNNYFPLFGENKCTDQSLYCKWDQPCKKSPEGFDQIYTFSVSEGKYVCQRGCNEGFEFKTPQSKNCEPVQVNITTFDNETTIYDRSSLIPTTPEGTTTTSSPTTTKPHEEEDAGVSSGKELGIVIAAVLCCFSIIAIYLAIGCGCYYRNVKRTCGCKGNSSKQYQAKFQREREIISSEGNSSSESNVQLQREPLMSPPDVTDPIPHVSAVKYVLRWPCYLPCFKEAPKMDLTSLPDNKEVRVMVGDPLELIIGISGSPTPTVTWLKDGKHIVGATEVIIDGVAKLEIRKAERSDTGKYQIKVANVIGSDTVDISVIVLEAPKIDHTSLPDKEVRVMVGDPLELIIGISGSPTPIVTWLKDGKRIERATISINDGVAKLEIRKAERSDTGKYQIKVENEIGSDTVDISVIVLEAPKIDHTKLPANKEVRVMVGEQLKLIICISGSPTPNVTWLKDGKRFERATESINTGMAKLEITKAECSDTGKYQIKVENEIGSDTADISVIVLDKPGTPGVPKCKTSTEDSITLFWTPPNRDGGNPVTGYVLERREKGDVIWETRSCSVNQVTEFTIKGLQEGKEYEFRAAACNNAGTGEFSNCSEPIQVQSLQDTKRNMQDSYIFDGRLILLDSDQIRRLEESLDKEAIGKGRIGTVYRCNNQDIFGITVAVKKIKTKEHANQIRREKIVSRLMNPFLLPLLAVIEKSDEECWFISPYFENGDLYDAIKRGKNEKDEQNNTEEININNQATRVKILLQIALAIEYIHTEVPNVRGPILHKDIASKNVVLDKYLNARLIDFGLAREKDDDMSTLGGRKHYDHPKVGTGCDEDYFDFYSFGVIIREMLTSLGPEGEKNHFLKKMNSNQIAERLDKNVWKYKETRDKLNELSQMCLKEDAAWTIEDFKSNVVDTLRVMFLAFDCNIFENGGESTCHQCIINPIVSAEKSSLTKDYYNCRQKIQVCMACEKNSFLNPITCYCGAKLKSAIGSNWGALLVAGDDDNPGKAAVMKKEILELEGLVTSQAPRIIGIRQHNVKTVVPCETNIEKMSAWTQIQKHIEAFSKDDEIDTLLIYFSCHGESSVEGNMFHLGRKEYISSDDFQKELDKLEKKDQLIIFLDRCFPPMVKFTDRKFIQINACSDKDAAVLKEEGSLFTKYVIQGLKARSEERKCSKDCQHCVDYWKPKTEYISVFALFDYVNNHLQQKAPDPYWQGQGVGKNIAFFTGEVVEVEFTLKDEKRYKRLPLKYLKHLDEVKERLFEAFGVGQRTHEVKIQKETFRQDQPYDECDTLEKVMQAWLQRLPLVVTFTAKGIN